MRHFAIVGSGPAGFYTAEAWLKAYGDNARIDIIDKLPVPYGLSRFGVAPDNQSIKAVAKRYEKVAEDPQARFVGNVAIGDTVSVADLRDMYDAVIFATGAPHDRKLGIEGEHLPGVIGSAAFVGWYNGHPDFADIDPPLDGEAAAIIGNGNVALDCARILSNTREEFAGSDIVNHAIDALDRSNIRTITLLGRRGPHQIAMTPKELGELGHLMDASPRVEIDDFPPADADSALEDRGLAKSVGHLREFASLTGGKAKAIVFDFFAKPLRIEGDGRAERVIVEWDTEATNPAAIHAVARSMGYTFEVPEHGKACPTLESRGQIGQPRRRCVDENRFEPLIRAGQHAKPYQQQGEAKQFLAGVPPV